MANVLDSGQRGEISWHFLVVVYMIINNHGDMENNNSKKHTSISQRSNDFLMFCPHYGKKEKKNCIGIAI